MNILQILPALKVGGGETGTLDLAKYLTARGHRAVVVSNGGALVEKLEACGAAHYTLPVHQKSLPVMLRMVPRLVDIIRRENIDIVHARSRVPAWIAWLACRRTGAVFVTTCHGYYSTNLMGRVMGWGSRVIVASKVIGRHMVEDFGVPPGRIRLIPRGVDLDKFRFVSPEKKRRPGEFRVGLVGRITPLKGHDHFIRAMARLRRAVPGLKVRIVGDAPPSKKRHKAMLEKLVRDLGLADCTEFLGVRRDIPQILADLDLLVMATTTQEAFGRVIVEAQAGGVPVVATKVGGVVDVIDDGRTGLLVPPADPEAMAEAALRLHDDPDLCRTMAANAYAKAHEKYPLALMAENTVKVYEEVSRPPRVLILKFTAIGDFVLATAALRAVRGRFPASRVTLLASPAAREVLAGCPYVDEVLVFDPRGRDRGLRALGRTAGSLKKKKFDIAIDLQNNRQSHLLAFLSGIPARYGYDNGKYGFLLNHRIRDRKRAGGPVNHQFEMLRLLGIPLDDPRLELWPSAADRRYIDDWLKSCGVGDDNVLLAGLNLAASPRWESKNWPLKHMAEFCAALGRKGVRVVLTGMNKDLATADRLLELAPDAGIINACAKTTVNQLACLIARCAVYVTPDSAPLHIAASQGTPFVALFGPTDPRRHLPPGERWCVIQKADSCGPCYKSKCATRACMEAITPREVLKAVEAFLPAGAGAHA